MLLFVGLSLLSVAVVWFDLRERRIPNALTFPALLLALLLRAPGGWSFVGEGAAAAGVCFAGGLLFFAMGALGGGDVKLLTATGAFLGLDRLLPALVLAAAAGGLLSLIMIARRGAWRRTARNLKLLFLTLASGTGVAGLRRSSEAVTSTIGPDGAPVLVPYGVAIAVGAVAGWWI